MQILDHKCTIIFIQDKGIKTYIVAPIHPQNTSDHARRTGNMRKTNATPVNVIVI